MIPPPIHEFNPDEWRSLTQSVRAMRCRLMSLETQALAQRVPAELKAIYEHMADQWEKLASEIERQAGLKQS